MTSVHPCHLEVEILWQVKSDSYLFWHFILWIQSQYTTKAIIHFRVNTRGQHMKDCECHQVGLFFHKLIRLKDTLLITEIVRFDNDKYLLHKNKLNNKQNLRHGEIWPWISWCWFIQKLDNLPHPVTNTCHSDH